MASISSYLARIGPVVANLRATAVPTPLRSHSSLLGHPGDAQDTLRRYSGANIDGSEALGDTI